MNLLQIVKATGDAFIARAVESVKTDAGTTVDSRVNLRTSEDRIVMNGANHQMNAVSTFPFYTLEGWEMSPPAKTDLPLKGDTVIENDVWIGQNSVILPGVHIGDGAIIGANSVVGSDVPPYTKVVGNPARAIQKRFDDELIELLLRFKWWDRSIDEINRLIPILTCSDLDKVKAEIKKQLG